MLANPCQVGEGGCSCAAGVLSRRWTIGNEGDGKARPRKRGVRAEARSLARAERRKNGGAADPRRAAAVSKAAAG